MSKKSLTPPSFIRRDNPKMTSKTGTIKKTMSPKTSPPGDTPVSSEDIESTRVLLENVSLEPLRDVVRDIEFSIGENLMEENSNPHFGIQLPPVQPEAPPEPEPSTSIPRGRREMKWYPNKYLPTVEGQNNDYYFSILDKVIESDINTFEIFKSAESVSSTIGCENTKLLWIRLNSLFRFLEGVDMPEILSDIARYMRFNPGGLDPYLKCLTRVKPYLTNPTSALKTLTETSTALTTVFHGLMDEAKAHQDEAAKFARQVGNVSSNLANLQESIEQTVLKISKLDLLPHVESAGPSTISIPSSLPKKRGIPVKKALLAEPGEYDGLFSFKTDGFKISSMIPPRQLPELEGLMTFSPEIQLIFINLDQGTLINKIMMNPLYKTVFTGEPSPSRQSLLRELGKGIKPKDFQWTKCSP